MNYKSELHLPVWDVYVDRITVVQQTSDVRHRRVQQPLALIQAALFDGLRERAWVSERIQLLVGVRQCGMLEEVVEMKMRSECKPGESVDRVHAHPSQPPSSEKPLTWMKKKKKKVHPLCRGKPRSHLDGVIPHAGDVHSGTRLQVGPAQVAVHGDLPVAFW